MLFLGLHWWEVVLYAIAFCTIIYLIINAPMSRDSTQVCDSGKSTSGNYSSDKPTLPNKVNK